MTTDKAAVFGDSRLPERFWSKVVRDPSGCWLWVACTNSAGYGQLRYYGRRMVSAHRLAFTVLANDIPAGLNLDHLCRVRNCCNPQHLEPVTSRENTLRGQSWSALNAAKTHCPKGHGYEGRNLYVSPAGKRKCRTCDREMKRAIRSSRPTAVTP